jgi:hypothetical protein
MKQSGWRFCLAVILTFGAASIWTPGSAIAGHLTVDVAQVDGTAAISSAQVEYLDLGGKLGDCVFKKLGKFLCDTKGAMAPLLLKGGTLYGYSETLTGFANVNGLTDFGVNQIYQSWSTSPGLQWASPTPLRITTPMLNSANGLMDKTFLLPLTDFKIKPTLTYNFFSTKYNFTSGLGKLLPLLNYNGAGTATEAIGAALPGGVTFSAMAKANIVTRGTITNWTVSNGSGATTYQSAYGMYPAAPEAPAVYLGISKFLKRELATLHHEGALLDSFNLARFYSSSFLENGDEQTNYLDKQATWLRKVSVKSLSISSIASFRQDQPTTGSDLIAANILRVSLNHGVPCVDDCCITFECGSDGSNCLEYGNQRIGSFMLRLSSESDYSSPTPTLSDILSAGGIAPSGTLSSYLIDDLNGIYNSAIIPFTKTFNVQVKPIHNLPKFPLQYDAFYLKKVFTPPVPTADRFSVEIDPLGGGDPQTFTTYPPPSTTETVKILSPTSFNTGDFFGKTVKFTVSTPSTFVVNGEFAQGVECAGSNSKLLNPIPPVLSPNATSFKIKTDLKLGKDLVTGAAYRITQRALNGPEIRATYTIGAGCSFSF